MDANLVFRMLYLPGLERGFSVFPKHWPKVESLWRIGQGDDLPETLRCAGLNAEALLLEDEHLRDRASEAVGAMVATDDAYPPNWRVRLGECAPPAVWSSGSVGVVPYLSIVGSREAGPCSLAFARALAAEAGRLGYGVVSGAAMGCDRAARNGAPAGGFDVLPYGSSLYRGSSAYISSFAPWDVFSRVSAMMRNTLIYACAELTVVCEARLKEGGSWHGAVDALRRKWPVAVHANGSAAACALEALGALPITSPENLTDLLQKIPSNRRKVA